MERVNGDPSMNAPFVASTLKGSLKTIDELEDEIAAHVGSLKALHARLNPDQVHKENFELALQELDALRDFTWGGLDPLVRYLVPLVVPTGRDIDPDHMNECLDEACEER